MLLLYNEKPISIFMLDKDHRVRVEFCNVKMIMKPCQFILFNNYLTNLSRRLDENTDNVELLLVKDSLNITISLIHFLQLCNGVQTVMTKQFGYKSKLLN